MKRFLLVTGTLLLSSAMTFGAGYQLNLQGLRQLAMGGSGTAIPWDASVVFYNPGALTDFSNVRLYASTQFVKPTVKYVQVPTGSYTAMTQSQVFPTFNVYVGGPVVDRSPVSIGLGVYTPFGAGLKWDDTWTGRYLIQEVKLHTIFIQPTVAYRISDVFSLGAGFIYATGGMNMRKAIPILNERGHDGAAELKGNANGVGFNAGLYIRASDNVRFGLTYRSQVNMRVNRGYASFSQLPLSVASQFPYTPFSTEMPLPRVITAGAGFKLAEFTALQVDISHVGWVAYDALDIDYEKNTSLLKDSHSPRSYKNTISFRGGFNHKFSDRFEGMIGAGWDPSPVRDGYVSPELPDANRMLYTAGATYKPFKDGKFTILGAVEYVSSEARTGNFTQENFDGKYQTTAFTAGLGVTYDF